MGALDAVLERKLATLSLPLAVVLPGGQRLGPDPAALTLRLRELGPLAHIAAGQIGKVAQDYVEGVRGISGMRKAIDMLGVSESPGLMAAATEFVFEGLHLHQKLNRDREGGRMSYRA